MVYQGGQNGSQLHAPDQRHIIVSLSKMQTSTHQLCPSCLSIQQLVAANQTMLQEQMKMIRAMREENDTLRAQLQMFSVPQQTQQVEKEEAGVQTEDSNKESPLSERSKQAKQLVVQSASKAEEGRKVRKGSMAVNKENIHEFIPMVMIRKNEEYFSRSRKGSYEDENHIPQWTKTLQAKPLIARKFRDKTVSLIRRGVPHEMRHLVWPAVVSNSLAITEQLYFQLLERRSAGWLPEQVGNQISKDIARSFSGRTQHEDRAGLRIEVSEVLELFHIYRPDVSYVQGMTYPTIVLVLVAGRTQAFNIFSNLVLANSFLRRLFSFEPNFMTIVTRAFDTLLPDYCPQIASKIHKQNIDSQMFLVEWFFTLFSRALSFQSTLKFWDQLLYYGEIALFRMALSVFEVIEPWIRDTNYEQTLGLIQSFGGYSSEQKLMECLSHHKLTGEKLERTLNKAEKSLSRKLSE